MAEFIGERTGRSRHDESTSRLKARVFRPAMAMFTANDAVLPFPLRQALDRVDTQLDLLIYEAFPLPKAS
jgi:hypothetical protein